MPLQTLELATLRTQIVEPEGGAGEVKLAVILCHGFGASGDDLVDLASSVHRMLTAAEDEVAFVFPEAPLSLASQGMPGGRAWWLLDLDRMLRYSTPELAQRFRSETPEGLADATAKLQQLVAEVRERYSLPAERIVLGGFSQGGMIAIDAALKLAEPPGALVIWSSSLINENEWKPLAAERGKLLRVIQSHGRQDPILPYSEATKLRDLLLASGAELEFLEFGGYHEIPMPAFQRFVHLLADML